MRRAVRILRRAQADLLEIQRYVERERPAVAARLVERLLETIESLEELPDRGAVPRDARLAAAGYRFLIEQGYLIFYKVFRRQLRVYRVLRGRREYRKSL